MATPKEAAIIYIMDRLRGSSPMFDADRIEPEIQRHFPQFKMTDTKAVKIAEEYSKQVARIEDMFGKYLNGRGIKL